MFNFSKTNLKTWQLVLVWKSVFFSFSCYQRSYLFGCRKLVRSSFVYFKKQICLMFIIIVIIIITIVVVIIITIIIIIVIITI